MVVITIQDHSISSFGQDRTIGALSDDKGSFHCDERPVDDHCSGSDYEVDVHFTIEPPYEVRQSVYPYPSLSLLKTHLDVEHHI